LPISKAEINQCQTQSSLKFKHSKQNKQSTQ